MTEEKLTQTSFLVDVKPCTVKTFEAISAPINDKFYTLNELGFLIGAYEFSQFNFALKSLIIFFQQPDCGYIESVTVLSLPSSGIGIVTHDSLAKTLSLTQTNNPNDLGVFKITIQSNFDQLQPDGSKK